MANYGKPVVLANPIEHEEAQTDGYLWRGGVQNVSGGGFMCVEAPRCDEPDHPVLPGALPSEDHDDGGVPVVSKGGA